MHDTKFGIFLIAITMSMWSFHASILSVIVQNVRVAKM